MEKLQNQLGKNLQTVRKSKKLTQEELAEICNLQASYIAGIESGIRNITIQTLEKISTGLAVSPEILLNINIHKNNYENNLLNEINSLLNDTNEFELKLINNVIVSILKTTRN